MLAFLPHVSGKIQSSLDTIDKAWCENRKKLSTARASRGEDGPSICFWQLKALSLKDTYMYLSNVACVRLHKRYIFTVRFQLQTKSAHSMFEKRLVSEFGGRKSGKWENAFQWGNSEILTNVWLAFLYKSWRIIHTLHKPIQSSTIQCNQAIFVHVSSSVVST